MKLFNNIIKKNNPYNKDFYKKLLEIKFKKVYSFI